MDELRVHESGAMECGVVHVSLLVFQVGNLRGPGGGPLDQSATGGVVTVGCGQRATLSSASFRGGAHIGAHTVR